MVMLFSSDAPIYVNVISEDTVEIIWTPTKLARLGFNVTLCKVMNTSLNLLQILQADSNSRTMRFTGLGE